MTSYEVVLSQSFKWSKIVLSQSFKYFENETSTLEWLILRLVKYFEFIMSPKIYLMSNILNIDFNKCLKFV